MPSAPRRTALVLIAAAASWGLGTVLSKYALDEISPLTLLPIQLAASVVALAVLVRLTNVSGPGPSRASVLARLGLLNPGLAYALTLLGLASISASLVVLVGAIEPILILVLAVRFLGERVTPTMIGLSGVAIGGTLLVVYDPASSGQWLGIVLVIAGVGCCAVYTIIARRWIGTTDSTLDVVAGQQVYGLAFAVVVFVIASLIDGGVVLPTSLLGWGSAIGSGVVYYAAAYWFYLTGLRAAPAFLAAASFYLIPVFGLAGSAILLGEQLDGRQWLGVIVVVGAVVGLARAQAATSRDGQPEAAPATP